MEFSFFFFISAGNVCGVMTVNYSWSDSSPLSHQWAAQRHWLTESHRGDSTPSPQSPLSSESSENHQLLPVSAPTVFRLHPEHESTVKTTWEWPNPSAPSVSPHGVEERAVVNEAQQLVRRGHVVGHGLLPVVEEGVRSPDLTGEQVVQG